MATQADVRRVALALPGVVQEPGRSAFAVPHKGKLKGFVWVWLERVHPKKARVPQPKDKAACRYPACSLVVRAERTHAAEVAAPAEHLAEP
jgi:hypothetical protein